MTQATCTVSGLPLYAIINKQGAVIGVENLEGRADCVIDRSAPSPAGEYHLPIYGMPPTHDPAADVLEPSYRVEADRVMRTYKLREKTARELMREISAWSTGKGSN